MSRQAEHFSDRVVDDFKDLPSFQDLEGISGPDSVKAYTDTLELIKEKITKLLNQQIEAAKSQKDD